jgi:hypothetical protein
MALFCFDPSFSWGTIVQICGFVGAIWGVTHQLREQRKLQREKYKNDLKINIYEKITNNIEDSIPTGIATTLDILVGSLDQARQKTGNSKYIPPPFRAEEIHEDFKKVHSNLWKTVGTIEKYEIISPNMPLFRQLLVKKIRELSDKYAPFIRVIPYILLSEGGINAPKYLLIPDDEECAQLYKKVDEFRNVAYDIAAYLYDIKVESQNILLSEFFENRVSLRKPNKEGAIVLTSEKEEMLDKIKELLEKNV